MLGNCEKIMTAISSTTNEWPQNQILNDHKSFMASSSSANKVMEKTNQDPHQHPLKCPRCDSSNTKFCYYNNYSLSQPRHFCKACKRYWTRGGTLRNVPVGGGCRKNKRAPKRQSSSGGDGISSAAASTATANPSVQPQIDLSPASNHIHNPLFYSLPTNSLELNFPFSTFRVSSDNSGFDLQHQMNGLGIGFSSGLMATEVPNNDYKNGYKPIQDVINNSSSSSFSTASNNSIFFGSSTFASTSTMASLLASSLQHQKFGNSGMKDIQAPNSIPGLMPFEDSQMPGTGNGLKGKEVKPEGQNRFVWNPNPIEQINSSDPSSLLWNTTNIGAWFDPSNMGSSVSSLI